MYKNIINALCILVLCHFAAAQSDIKMGVEYGHSSLRISNSANFSGHYAALFRQSTIIGQWALLTQRLAGNYTTRERSTFEGPFQDLSAGVNVDVMFGGQIGLKGLYASANVGPSLRYARAKHITQGSLLNGVFVQYSFIDTTGFDVGAVADVGLDYEVFPRVFVGARAAYRTYRGDNNGTLRNGYQSVALSVKVGL